MEGIANWLESHQGTCWIKSATGHECPGCGIQRAFVALLRGDLEAAWDFYPPLFPLLLTLLMVVLALTWKRMPRRFPLLIGTFSLFVGFVLVNFAWKTF